MGRHPRLRAWLAGALLLLSGCGTCFSLGARIAYGAGPIVYSGVRFDTRRIIPTPPDQIWLPWMVPLAIVDWPLSLALDTAALPVTLIWAAVAEDEADVPPSER